MIKRETTEGEQNIEIFLEERGIKFIREYNLGKLQGDSKNFRIADFYLPRYKVCLEFFGKWNDNRDPYNEKRRVYEINRIPCVYIYPDNLGTLEHVFNWRLRKELEKYGELSYQFSLFKLDKLKKGIYTMLTFWLLGMLLIIMIDNIENKQLVVGYMTKVGFIILSLFCIVVLAYGINMIFFSKKK